MGDALKQRVWDNRTTRGSERLALLALAFFADDATHLCDMRLRTLARLIRMDERYTRKIIAALEAKGLIKREHALDEYDAYLTTRYTVFPTDSEV